VAERVRERFAGDPVRVGADQRWQVGCCAQHGDPRMPVRSDLGRTGAHGVVEPPPLERGTELGEAGVQVGRGRLQLDRGPRDGRPEGVGNAALE
jgi:hypothetical protein